MRSLPNKKIFGALVVLCIIFGIAAVVFYLTSGTTVQEKISPVGSHRAKLVRHDGIDVNFQVVVDGEKVFRSPDFAPVRDDFREQIVWDATGKVMVLEVAGQRLFGYDAERKRRLTDEELLAVEYTPFARYRYEGTLPKRQE
jgi:hypothetical protein